MIVTTIFAIAILCSLGLLAAYAHRRSEAFSENRTVSHPGYSDRESFTDYYRPMMRMLDSRELDSARKLDGVRHDVFARFRNRRVASFRAYLRDMRLDFYRIDFKMRYLLLAASGQEADLVQRLNSLKFNFQMQLWRVECQLIVFRFGYGSIEISPLIEMLELFESALVRRPALNAAGV